MTDDSAKKTFKKHTNRRFIIGLMRAFAGAILFALPLMMTMEMWALGSSIERYRLVLFMALAIPLLIGLSYFVGFEETETLFDDAIDAFVAYAVGFFTSAIMLFLFGVLNFEMSIEEMIGVISIQATVSAIGAMLAQSELGGNDKD